MTEWAISREYMASWKESGKQPDLTQHRWSELLDLLNNCDCEIKVVTQSKCQRVPFSEIQFNDDTEPKLMEWLGTCDELREWLSTPWGAMSMFAMRRCSPVHVHIPHENIWVNMWSPDQNNQQEHDIP